MSKQNLDDVLKALDPPEKLDEECKKIREQTEEKWATYKKTEQLALEEKEKLKQAEEVAAEQKHNALIDKIRKFLKTPIRKADSYPFDMQCTARLVDIDKNGTAKLIINGDEVEMAASKVFSEFKPISSPKIDKSDKKSKS